MTLVTPGIDAEGRVIITSRGTTYKVKHLRRDPRVSMLIFGEQYSGSKFVQIHGTAEIIDLPQAMDGLIYWYKTGARRTQKLGRLQETDDRRKTRPDPHQYRESRAAERESNLAEIGRKERMFAKNVTKVSATVRNLLHVISSVARI